MRTNQIKPETIGKIISAVGLIVLIGWMFDITLLKSIQPDYTSMKIATAISFILTGLIICYTTKEIKQHNDTAAIILPVSSFIILFLMLTFLLSQTLGLPPYIQDLLIQEKQAKNTEFLGAPSITTAILFIIISLTAIATTLHYQYAKKIIKITGIILTTASIIALIGYLTNTPLLYYKFPGTSNAVAIHTAILFLLTGIAYKKISETTSPKTSK